MNSLEELNLWNQGISIEYTDVRISGVEFDRLAAENQVIVVNEGSTFSSPAGIEIQDVINPSAALVTYTIDISNAPVGTTVSWTTIPSGCTVTQPGPTLYRISGIDSAGIWDQIKNPEIDLPTGIPESFFGTFTYSSTINYNDGNLGPLQKTWNIVTTVLDVTILNSPLETVYNLNSTNDVEYAPNIVYDVGYEAATWTLVGTPNINSSITDWSSTSTLGGTFSVNSTSKVFTVTGTKIQVNEYMNNLKLVSNAAAIDFVVSYALSNSIDGTTDVKTQTFKNADIRYLTNPLTLNVFYTEDSDLIEIEGNPQISDSGYTGSGIYVLKITPSPSTAIKSISVSGTAGTFYYNPSTKVGTLTGTKTEINTRLNNISMVPATDYSDLINITYQVTTPESNIASKIQTLVCNSADPEVDNIAVSRNYIANQSNLIFSTTTPVINDFDVDPSNTYTIILTSALGKFAVGSDTPVATYSYTGNRTQVNAIYSQIKFYPTVGVSSNGTATYTQQKNGITQLTQSIPLLGAAGTYPSRTVDFTVTQSWAPTQEDLLYGKISDLLLVGGGGGGNTNNGGGGAQVKEQFDINITETSYNIVVGAGGAVNNNGSTTTAFGYTANGGFTNGSVYFNDLESLQNIGCFEFDGSGDYIRIDPSSNFDFGSGSLSSFTMECWIYSSSHTDYTPYICARGSSGANVLAPVGGKLGWTNGNTWLIGTDNIPLNRWNHVAISKNGTTVKTFLNGVQQISTLYSGSSGGSNIYVYVGIFDDLTNAYAGKIDEVRITKGISRYNDTFSLSRAEFVDDANTVLLLHANGNFNDDNSSGRTAKNVTAFGNVSVNDLINFNFPTRLAGRSASGTQNGDPWSGTGGGMGYGIAPEGYTVWPPTAGGRVTYRDDTARKYVGIDADFVTTSGTNPVGYGGLGPILTGYFAITPGSGYQGTSNAGYGFGGGGGSTTTDTITLLGQGGYAESDGSVFYGSGAYKTATQTVNAVKPDKYVGMTRDPSVAGGGGGAAGGIATAAPGGDGVVRIRIVQR